MTTDTMIKLLALILIILSVYRTVEDYKETGMLFRMCYVVPFIVGLVMVVIP
jgi:hypothetical protein